MAVRERVTELKTSPGDYAAVEPCLDSLSEREKVLQQMLEAEIQKRTGFVRALVHELKTPLTAVLASSELMTTGLRQEPWLSLARNIHKGAGNLNRRIDELLDLARGETGLLNLKTQLVNLRQFLYQISGDMTPLASKQRKKLELEVPSSLPVVQVDEERLRQVLMNLLNNALRFTPRDGEIQLKCCEKSGSIMFTVTDQGPGIAESVQKRLFEPYQRWEDDAEILSGLRLGLALSKILVELHGGEIWVESCQGSGSTFGFSLPLR